MKQDNYKGTEYRPLQRDGYCVSCCKDIERGAEKVVRFYAKRCYHTLCIDCFTKWVELVQNDGVVEVP